jgi:hypothetical protein
MHLRPTSTATFLLKKKNLYGNDSVTDCHIPVSLYCCVPASPETGRGYAKRKGRGWDTYIIHQFTGMRHIY